MELTERILKYYTDVNHGRKNVFLVSERELGELLGLRKVGELDVVRVDSQRIADVYTLERENHPEYKLGEMVIPARFYDKVVVQFGNLYVLDTKTMEKPVEFTFDFLTNRFYDCRHETTSAVVAIKDHVDMYNRMNRPELFFTNWQKFSMVIQDLSQKDPYWFEMK